MQNRAKEEKYVLFYTKTFKTQVRRALKANSVLRDSLEEVLLDFLVDPFSVKYSTIIFDSKKINITKFDRYAYLLWIDEGDKRIHLVGMKA